MGSGAVGRQADEVLLAGVQRLKLGGELLMEEPGGGFFFADRFGDVGADVGDERGTEADGGVVRLDGVLDQDDVDVRGVAGAGLLVAAEEVGVGGALGVDDVLEDQASSAAGVLAASAEDRTFQVVVVHAAALLRGRTGLDDVLDLVEEVLVDQGLVAPLDLLVLVGDVTEVVAVAQQVRELVDRHLLGGVSGVGPGTQPSVVQLVGEVGEGVVAGGVQLEGELHVGRAFRVDGDRADLAAFEAVKDVEVAQWCAAEGAAVLGFLAHLVGDVGAGLAGLVLVEGGQDAVHELPNRRVVDGLGGGDEGDAALA